MKAPFSVVKLPEKSLRERSRELSREEVLTPEFQDYLDRLVVTMYAENGVGIASPQVGRNIRAVVVNPDGRPECWMNPEIIKRSSATVDSEEGCLSVPKKYGLVKRHKKITVRAMNRHGRVEERELKGFPAIVWQHEVDHLDGTLFVDRAEQIVDADEVKKD